MHGPIPQPWVAGAGRVGRVLTLVFALGLALVGTSGAALAQDDEPDILKVAHTANITTWDPVKSFSTEALYLANMYEPLLWVNPPGSAEPFTPALATEWETSEDGLTWTFHLRDGVTFQDGEPLTADCRRQFRGGRQGARWCLVHLGAGRVRRGGRPLDRGDSISATRRRWTSSPLRSTAPGS